ncbi:MAG: TIGR02996 domain-containing protein [Gemmataceae bacterium]
MSNEKSFLDAIAADPENTTIRLVYADWLEEQGRTEAAEYLLQVSHFFVM